MLFNKLLTMFYFNDYLGENHEKKFLILLCLIALIFSMAGVSAADANQTIFSDTPILGNADGGTFTELQDKINDAEEGSTITLENNYTYDNSFKGEYISIAKNITVDGKGYTINANNASGIFNINATNVVLNNITFVNGKSMDGGAVYSEGNLIINDCRFIDNVASEGGAVYVSLNTLKINNCSFINNIADGRGAAILSYDSYTLISDSLFLNNSGSAAVCFLNDYVGNFSVSNSVFNDNVAGESLWLDHPYHDDYTNGIVHLTSNGNLADNQILVSVYLSFDVPFPNIVFSNVSYNRFKNQSFRISEIDYRKLDSGLDNKTIRFEVYDEDKLLINTTNTTVEGIAKIYYENLVGADFYLNVFYMNIADSAPLKVKKDPNFTMSVDDIVIGDDLIVDFNISSDIEQRDEYYGYAAGYITILRYDDESQDYVWAFDDYFYFKNNNITVPALPSGSYVACLEFRGDKYYFPKSINQSFIIYPADYNMTGNKTVLNLGFEKTSDENRRLCINLTDIGGNPLNDKEIFIKINGVTYKRTTNMNGQASIAVNLGMEGDFSAVVSFKGDDVYLPTTEIATISIPFTILCDIFMSKYCGEPRPFTASFLGYDGDYLSEGKATFNINGVFYARNIDSNGQAKLNINLHPGNYTITATNPVTGVMRSCWIEVLPTITDNHDLVKYYKNDSQYIVKLQGGNIAGQKVTFNINGVFYERYSNDEGFVKLNINLPPNDYIITAEFNGCRVSNNISVLPVLEANDLKMTYKDGSTFNVALVDGHGNPYAGQSITFNINGVFYERTTNENGVARLNINLMAGEYIITSSYNGGNIANKITITS